MDLFLSPIKKCLLFSVHLGHNFLQNLANHLLALGDTKRTRLINQIFNNLTGLLNNPYHPEGLNV